MPRPAQQDPEGEPEDEDGEPHGGGVFGDRVVRKYRGSTRPPDVIPELWRILGPKQKERAIADYKAGRKLPGAPIGGASAPSAVVVDGPDCAPVPAMPVLNNKEWKHRDKLSLNNLPWNLHACVARPVGKAEVRENPKALQALLLEWEKLRKVNTWDESGVKEWKEVSEEARRKGETVHVGLIFELCTEKGSELPDGDPGKKYKGRVVFQGNEVRDQNFDYAMFDELSSAPATMAAAKAADAFGGLKGHATEQADAEQAYIQAKLGGKPTWVRLPKDRWPAAWKGMRDPVCPLRLALYGHPDSGGYWEKHCAEHLLSIGSAYQGVAQLFLSQQVRPLLDRLRGRFQDVWAG